MDLYLDTVTSRNCDTFTQTSIFQGNKRTKEIMRFLSSALLVFIFAALSLLSETCASSLRAEPRDGATMPKVDGEWRQYVVPAGEKDAGKIFYYNMQLQK